MNSLGLKDGMGKYHLQLLESTKEKTEKIKAMIDLDSSLTQREIAEQLGIGVSAVGKIMRKLRETNETI